LGSSLISQGQELKLPDAINIALKNSLDIQLAKNNQQIAQIGNSFGMAGGLPLITANGSDQEQWIDVKQKINTPSGIQDIERKGASSNQLNSNLTVGQLLFNGFRVVATRKRLAELEKQSELYVNSQIQNVIASVMTSYFDVVRQQYYLKALNRSIEVGSRRLEIVKAQQSVGLANNADLFQSQLDLNNLEQAKKSQLSTIEQAKTTLLTALTLRPDSAITVTDTIIVDRSLILGDILQKLPSNPDLLAADDQIRINELIVKETAAQRYPTLRATTGYNFNRNQAAAGQTLLNQTNGPFLGVNLGIPIYNGSIYKRQTQIAEVNTKNASLQRGMLQRDYSANAVKTFEAYSAALEQLETARKNLALSQQLLNLVLMRFELRQATIVDVTLAQQGFETAAYSVINLSYVAKSSEVELRRVSSTLTPSN
jgi:outer membrane protein TolC